MLHLLLVIWQQFLDDASPDIRMMTPSIYMTIWLQHAEEASPLLPLPFFLLCFSIYLSLSPPPLLLSLCVFLQRLPVFEHHTVLTYWPSTPSTRRERTTGKLAYGAMDLRFPVWLFPFISVFRMGLLAVTARLLGSALCCKNTSAWNKN